MSHIWGLSLVLSLSLGWTKAQQTNFTRWGCILNHLWSRTCKRKVLLEIHSDPHMQICEVKILLFILTNINQDKKALWNDLYYDILIQSCFCTFFPADCLIGHRAVLLVLGSWCVAHWVCKGWGATDVNAFSSACGVESEKLGSDSVHLGCNQQLSDFAGVLLSES